MSIFCIHSVTIDFLVDDKEICSNSLSNNARFECMLGPGPVTIDFLKK